MFAFEVPFVVNEFTIFVYLHALNIFADDRNGCNYDRSVQIVENGEQMRLQQLLGLYDTSSFGGRPI